MALQWMILTYVVALEAAIALLVTLPTPKAVKSAIVSLVSLVLQPAMFVVPFAGFQLLGTSLSRSLPPLSLSLSLVMDMYLLFVMYFRYLLEERASFDVYRRDLHCC